MALTLTLALAMTLALALAGGLRPEGQHADQGHAKTGARIGRQRQIPPPHNRGLVVELHVLGNDALGQLSHQRH